MALSSVQRPLGNIDHIPLLEQGITLESTRPRYPPHIPATRGTRVASSTGLVSKIHREPQNPRGKGGIKPFHSS